MRIILSHRYLDFDALASMIAAQKLFPDAVMVMNGEVSSSVQEFMALAKEQLPFYHLRDLKLDDVKGVILVDINDFRKTSLSAEAIRSLQQLPLHIFDHHPIVGETPFVRQTSQAETAKASQAANVDRTARASETIKASETAKAAQTANTANAVNMDETANTGEAVTVSEAVTIGEAVTVGEAVTIGGYASTGEPPFRGLHMENIHIEPVGATVTLLVEQLAARGGVHLISNFESTLMMLGIYDDTGCLLFENTTPRDVEAAAFLLRHGAQLGVVAEYLHTPLSPPQLALFQQLLDHGTVEKIRGVPVYFSFAEDKAFTGGLSLLAHRIGEIESADVWFILVSMENRVHIVARSRHAQVAVNRIMGAFGGSGHVKAASATVKNGSLSDVLSQLKLEIAKWVNAPQTAREIMSCPVKTVTSDTKMGELGKILLRHGHTGMPVVDDGVLLGVISRRDIDKALRYDLSHAPVKGFMSREVVTVEPDASWEDVQQCMITHDIGRVLVVEQGNLAGIITRSDILRLIYGRTLPTAGQLAQDRGMAMREDVCTMLDNLAEPLRSLIAAVTAVAGNLALGVYLVGGFVRDLLLNMPTQDVDIVVEGQAEELARALCEELPGSRFEVYGQFGTARIYWQEDSFPATMKGIPADMKPFHIDIAGSRSEVYDSPGALPTVEGSTLRDDLFRRDFTINAMAICLNRERLGELIDYYGGLRDLQQKEIRILHNMSFIDDPMRMIRALRFAGRYGFVLARLTHDAVRTALREGALAAVSAERFSEELQLVLIEDEFAAIWRKLGQAGVLRAWFQADYPWCLDWPVGPQETKAWPALQRWLAMLIEMSDEQVAAVLQRLKFSRQWRKDTETFLQVRQSLRNSLGTLEETDLILAGAPVWLDDVLRLDAGLAEVITDYRRAVAGMDMRITGQDLLQRGVPEGPCIGRLLRQIRIRWLEGRILDAEDENSYLDYLLSNVRSEARY